MASSGTAPLIEYDTISKGTMPKPDKQVDAHGVATPQTEKFPFDNKLWDTGGQVPAHAADVSKTGGGVYIDPSINRMHDDTSGYKSF